jgi:hypothetical protein
VVDPVVRPIGISAALAKVGSEPLWRGNGWPPADVGPNPSNLAGDWDYSTIPPVPPLKSIFERSSWDPYFLAIAVLSRFAGTQAWNAASIETALRNELPPTLTALNDEFQELADLIQYRPGVLTEALSQSDSMINAFRGVLSFTAQTHPYTYGLCKIVETIGIFQAMYYKAIFNRARPSTLSPKLMPATDVPGHASFPSGHATQAYLMALMLSNVMPSAAWKAFDPSTAIEIIDSDGLSTGPLFRLAERIARNREILGLHWPSDSRAGKVLAIETEPLLTQTFARLNTNADSFPTNQNFNYLGMAAAEWT